MHDTASGTYDVGNTIKTIHDSVCHPHNVTLPHGVLSRFEMGRVTIPHRCIAGRSKKVLLMMESMQVAPLAQALVPWGHTAPSQHIGQRVRFHPEPQHCAHAANTERLLQ